MSDATSNAAGRKGIGGTGWREATSVSGGRRSWDEPLMKHRPRRFCSDFFASWVQPLCHSHHSVLSLAPACVTVGPVLTGKFIRSQCPQPDAAHQLFQLFKVKTLKVYIFRCILLDQSLWCCPKINSYLYTRIYMWFMLSFFWLSCAAISLRKPSMDNPVCLRASFAFHLHPSQINHK